jgi:hypothetical protein
MVEYALGIALLIVAGLVAFNFLNQAADEQATAQADCISMRPPPTTCVRQPVPAPTTSTPSGSATSSTTISPSPTVAPTTTTTVPPPESTLTAGAATVANGAGGTWQVSAPVTVVDDDDNPVAGATIVGRVLIGRQPVLTECTTGADGTCSLALTDIPGDVASATMTVVEVRSEPPAAGGPYPSWNLTKPS